MTMFLSYRVRLARAVPTGVDGLGGASYKYDGGKIAEEYGQRRVRRYRIERTPGMFRTGKMGTRERKGRRMTGWGEL